MIEEVVDFLDGRADEVVRRVRERMELAAESLDFERAAELRDALKHLQKMEEPTVVVRIAGGDTDVIGYARDGDDASVVVLRIRGGKLLAREHRFLENIEGEEDAVALTAYLASSYVQTHDRAPEVLLPFEVADSHLLAESLGVTKMLIPQRGSKRELIDLAEQNARHLLEEFKLAAL